MKKIWLAIYSAFDWFLWFCSNINDGVFEIIDKIVWWRYSALWALLCALCTIGAFGISIISLFALAIPLIKMHLISIGMTHTILCTFAIATPLTLWIYDHTALKAGDLFDRKLAEFCHRH